MYDNLDRKQQKQIIIALFLLVLGFMMFWANQVFPATAASYRITIYQIDGPTGIEPPVVLRYYSGQVLEIGWTQPSTSMPYNGQPDPVGVGTRIDTAAVLIVTDSLVSVADSSKLVPGYPVALNPGFYELAITACGVSGECSKESNPVKFEIIETVPGRPVNIYVRLK